jgi:hypothetical protein
MRTPILPITLLLVASAACGDDDHPHDAAAHDSGGSADGGAGTDGGVSLCETGCTATVAAACSMGPASQAECVADCEMLTTGSCGAEFSAYQTCGEGETVTCDAMGLPTVEACSTERAAFVACLSM